MLQVVDIKFDLSRGRRGKSHPEAGEGPSRSGGKRPGGGANMLQGDAITLPKGANKSLNGGEWLKRRWRSVIFGIFIVAL